jgi:hypothetical protein
MKQITNQQAINFLKALIEKVDTKFTKTIDDPKTGRISADKLEAQSLSIISDIQKTISHISLYN